MTGLVALSAVLTSRPMHVLDEQHLAESKRIAGQLRRGRFATRRAVRAAMAVTALAGALGVLVDLVYDSVEREVAAEELRAQRSTE